MEPVLQQGETRTYWVVVCSECHNGGWLHHKIYWTREVALQKIRHLRRWHPNAFLASMVITQCDNENPEPSLAAPSPNPFPTGRPQLRLV